MALGQKFRLSRGKIDANCSLRYSNHEQINGFAEAMREESWRGYCEGNVGEMAPVKSIID